MACTFQNDCKIILKRIITECCYKGFNLCQPLTKLDEAIRTVTRSSACRESSRLPKQIYYVLEYIFKKLTNNYM